MKPTILKDKYPAKTHCEKVVERLKSHSGEDVPTLLYLQGQTTRMKEDNDEPQPFRQRRNFFYLTGCALPDCHLTYDVQKAELTLYIPPLDPSSVIWSGLPLSEEDALKIYDIDHCLPSNKLESYLSSLPAGTKLAHTGRGDLPIADSPFFQSADTDKLHTAIEACRVRKDEYEVALLRHANAITTAAHTAVLQAIPGASNEQELEGRFIEQSIAHGAKEQAYHGIFGSGSNAATLHYQNNDEPLAGRRNLLVDAAAEWSCYCADVTRTMPLLGKFDMESESIYVIVQSMQEACFKLLRADVAWEDVHIRAHEVAVEGLLALGILKGDKTEIMAARTSVAFFPHGLGHYLGLDTHDCGGNPNYEDSDPMFKYLRVRGQVPEGAVVTVEPGVYFCRFIIEPYLKDEKQSRFIDQAVLDKYWDVGGVRIEDNCLITKDGFENLTTAPKSVEEMVEIIRAAREDRGNTRGWISSK